ncbi:c-type cytochrome [Cucumibacter marinus]|uniref:c-type cytochrome n=1 Tax=Cucumibacter marinus TaxID=1121252 RepID=UPI000413CBF9|nr:cytochrome c [Cucumibacter marinus]
MRRWRSILVILIIIGIGAAFFLLKPVGGPERDLTLTADAERGAYVMLVSGCVTCHTDTKNDGERLAGGAPLETPFGAFIPPNITPHPEAGIGSWRLADFARALSVGEGPGIKHYYPSFPYDNYTLMTDQDVVDLYAALMEEDPVATPSEPHQVGFPFNIRLAMAGWKNLFFAPQRFEPDPSRSERWNRGAYLVNGPAHCAACHAPRNPLGAREANLGLVGSSGTPAGNVPGIDKASLEEGGYDMPGLVDTLKTGFTPGFDVLGRAMGEVIEFSTSQWRDEDLEAVAAYLLDTD